MAYGKEKDVERIEIYSKVFADVNPDLLKKAVTACVLKIKFLPSIAEIAAELKESALQMHPELIVKSWDEVLLEINNKIRHGEHWGKTEWSDTLVAQVVETYGWNRIRYCSEASWPMVVNQLKNVYDICANKKMKDVSNGYIINCGKLLGNNSQGYIDKGDEGNEI